MTTGNIARDALVHLLFERREGFALMDDYEGSRELDLAREEADAILALAQPAAGVAELVEAIRLTVEYVGLETLPPIEGWSWYDALTKYAPELAAHFRNEDTRLRALAARPQGGAA